MITNNHGSLTIDFLFASILVMGVSAVLFALSLSMTIVEVSQYVAFASSRSYYAAHFNPDAQELIAEQKFTQLTKQTKWKNLFKKNGWFKLTYVNSGDFRDEYQSNETHDNDRFWGTVLKFESNVLDFQLPFVGSTNPDDEKFTANINSFLGREPTSSECSNFTKQRFEHILQLDGKYQSQIDTLDAYVGITDNGC